MWNQKNQSYLNMKSHLPNSIYIKIESFNKNKLFFDEVIKIGDGGNYNFIEEKRYLSGYVFWQNVRRSLSIPNLKNEELEVIDSYIDKNI